MGLGLYLGIMLVMAIYNLFIFSAIRDKTYLYYVGYVCCLVMWLASYFGFSQMYLWPDYPEMGNRLIIVFACLWCVFMLQFVRSFLDTARFTPLFDKMCSIGTLILGVLLFMALLGSYALVSKVIITMAMFFCLPCLLAAFRSWQSGNLSARYFLFAWSVMLLALFVFALKVAGLLPAIFIVENAVQIGSAIEVTLLSLGLADRINMLKRQKEAAQKDALAAAHAASKLKDEFLANTSHELRTPLNGIIGLAESLIDGVAGKLPDKANYNLSMVANSGRRLANLVNDILDFAKLNDSKIKLNKRPVDLSVLTDVVLTLSTPLVGEKQLTLVNAVPKHLPCALADEDRLLQVLHNLVGNGIKFTNSGSVTVGAELDGQKLKIWVIDTGIGIDESQFKVIFSSFEQGEGSSQRQYGGTGLGLAVSQQLVMLHASQLEVESELGEGTQFSFTLPVAEAMENNHESSTDKPQQLSNLSQSVSRLSVAPIEDYVATSNQQTAVQHSTSVDTGLPSNEAMADTSVDSSSAEYKSGQSTFKILIVDDEPINRQVLLDHLSLPNYQLYEAGSGQQALDLLAEHGEFDIVLLDVMMPMMSGYEVCDRIRQQWAVNDLPVIFLTAKTQVSDLVQSFSVGANDYLTKPITKHELLTRVAIHLKLLDINRNLESKVAQRSAELVQAGKMASLGTLTAGVAHEINNPTNFVHASAHNLHVDLSRFHQYLVDLAGDEAENEVLVSFEAQFGELFEHLVTIKEGTTRITRIVQDLRVFSQLEAADKKEESIQQCLLSTINLVRTKYAEVADIVTHFERQDAMLMCYPAQLNQVFMNLIVNACDAIRANQSQKDNDIIGTVVVACRKTDTHIEVKITDDGCGMSDKTKTKLFEPFYTTKSEGEGTGLGLSISYGIVRKHQGELIVESQLGKGSVFTLILPFDKS